MRNFITPAIVILAAALGGCGGDSSTADKTPGANASPLRPAFSKAEQGIELKLYRDVELGRVLAELPAGSVDKLDLDATTEVQQTIAIVSGVSGAPTHDLTRAHLVTKFKTSDGRTIEKLWEPASDRKAAVGVFAISAHVVDGDTTVTIDAKK